MTIPVAYMSACFDFGIDSAVVPKSSGAIQAYVPSPRCAEKENPGIFTPTAVTLARPKSASRAVWFESTKMLSW